MDELNQERALALVVERPVNLMPAPVAHLKEVAVLMAESGPLVGVAFQGSPERCFAIAYQSAWWSRHGTTFDPFAVSQKAYVTKDQRSGAERINYEAQLIVALVNANAPLREPLRVSYAGVGPTRTCTIEGLLKGSDEWKSYTSPTFGQIKVKNSPLWFSDPDQQLYYYAARMWARRWSPQTIMGVYGADEMPEYVPATVRAAETLYSDEPAEIQEAEFEDAEGNISQRSDAQPKPDKAEDRPSVPVEPEATRVDAGAEGSAATDQASDLPEALREPQDQPDEPPGSAADREWLAKKQHHIMQNLTLGRPDGADVWAELLFAAKRFKRVVAYQQALANVVKANVDDHLARLRAASEAGADPESGELFK